MRIYNSVGELVRSYPTETVERTITTFVLTYTASGSCTAWSSNLAEPFSPDGDCRNDILVFDFPELTNTTTGARYDRFRWDGKTSRGEWAPNAQYLAQAVTTSTEFGTGITATRTITLSARRVQIIARIFNAAGVLVIELPAVSNPGVAKVRVNPPLFEPDVTGTKVVKFELLDPNGSTLGLITWNGKDAQDYLVANGTYAVSMDVTTEDGTHMVLTARFSVAHGELNLISNAGLIPNPASAKTGLVWIHYLVVTPSRLTQVAVKIYTMAGEIVASFDATRQPPPADPMDTSGDGAGAVSWNFSNARGQTVAPGLYLVVIEAQDQSGQLQRVPVKLGVLQ